MLDTHRLFVFRSVVAAGSVNRAAGLLGYSPSAVSQQLAALQRETGLTLFERAGRGIEITASGRLLATASEPVLEQLGRLDATVADLRAGRAGNLTIHAFDTAGTHWMPPVVAALTREFPDTAVRLRIDEEVRGIQAHRPDVAVVVAFSESDHVDGYVLHPLIREPYVVVVPRTHPLADRGSVTMAELATERWVDNDVARGPCRQAVVEAAAAAGFAPQFVVETTNYMSAIRFVAHGIGITVVPRIGATDLPADAVALTVSDPTPGRVVVAYVRDAVADTTVVRRALDLVRTQVGATEVGAPQRAT